MTTEHDPFGIQKIVAYIGECSLRGLCETTKWLSWLLESVSKNPVKLTFCEISPIYLKAKSLFDDHEYERASMVLSSISNRNSLEQFLFYNSQFQQLQRNELISHANFLFTEEQDELQTKQEANQLQLYVELAKEIDSLAEKDSFLLYLLGKIKAKFCKDNTTIQILYRALLEGPLNWDCWTLLGSIVEDESHFAEINKQLVFDEQFWFMPLMFRLKVMTRLQEDFGGSMSALKKLRSSGMNNFFYLDLLEGIIHYNQRDFDSAEKIFDDLIERDKFMLEAYDYLSNILYIREEQQKLAILAQQAYRIDPLRPESCCVVGNFWSLKQEHTLAIQQFQKALKLDPDYLSAWVLMGHEYLELRATSSAIECYRNALMRDKNDYRAWYGLGQTYELLKLNSYALYYYQKAAHCKLNDSRMWNALSSIHFQLGDLSNALETLRKAYKLEPQDCSIGLKLSKLYLKSSKTEEAMRVYQELMKNDSFWTQCSPQEISNALWQLAVHQYRNNRFDEAQELCTKIFQYGTMEKESAQELLSLIASKKREV